jgi:uncharacterized protein
LVSALASRSGGVTIIAALSLVMGPLGPLVGVIWLRRTRKPWFWINLDRETQITPARRPDDAYVREPFTKLENGDGAAFFDHVDDKVDWTVEGTHPLAGHYRSKADFIAGTFAKLNKVLPQGAQLVVQHLLVKDDWAVVELRSLATARNGFRFNNHYCWLVHFNGTTIDRVRAYLDSAMVARLFAENPVS